MILCNKFYKLNSGDAGLFYLISSLNLGEFSYFGIIVYLVCLLNDLFGGLTKFLFFCVLVVSLAGVRDVFDYDILTEFSFATL